MQRCWSVDKLFGEAETKVTLCFRLKNKNWCWRKTLWRVSSMHESYLLIHPKGCEELVVRAAWGCAPWGRLILLEVWESGDLQYLEAFLLEGVQLPPPRSSQSLQAGRNLRNKKADKQVNLLFAPTALLTVTWREEEETVRRSKKTPHTTWMQSTLQLWIRS